MSASERIPVVPSLLIWARETSGLTVAVAAKRIGISEETLTKWESGELMPTIKQLRTAAKHYKRPLAVMLLPRPPKEFDAMRDFRRTSDTGRDWSPELRTEFKRALSQREVVLELAELAPGSVAEPARTLEIVENTPAEEAAGVIRNSLGIPANKSFAGPNEALNAWVTATEELGILVIHTRKTSVQEMRGFSVSEWPYPVVALNGGDFPRPRLFTLAHELSHIALNAGGLCDLHEQKGKRSAVDDYEHYCNSVAAALLMPADVVLSDALVQRANASHPWTLEELAALSRRFNTSSESILLRLITLQRATWDLYWTRKPELEHEYDEARKRQKEQQRESEGGPSFYVVKARDLGRGYVSSVLEAFRSRAISSLDASEYLEVRYEQLPKLEKAVLR